MITEPVNKYAIPEVRNVLTYLNSIEGRAILTGQHTQTMEQPELKQIFSITGKLPALCGFELLSYSPNIRRETAGAECLKEVDENYGTLEKAWEWAELEGLITFTWHWFSPLGGTDKSFYTEHTTFDPQKALAEDTPEHEAMLHDLDCMAKLLRPFCDKHIPILWRPFHESEGNWFWWGSKGPETARALFRFQYHYFTEKHALNNLIWVFNSPLKEGYVGDTYCDIISMDMYPKPHCHGDFHENYQKLSQMTSAAKGAAIAETGILPDANALAQSHIPWLWYMTWSNDFVLTENFNSFDALKQLYQHPYAITLDRLPKLY